MDYSPSTILSSFKEKSCNNVKDKSGNDHIPGERIKHNAQNGSANEQYEG